MPEWATLKQAGTLTGSFHPPQDRPEFSEVVSNLEECLCNVEVRNSRPCKVSTNIKNKSSHPLYVCLLGS